MKPTRPLLRWHGGKWLLAPWIIEHFPAHRTYVEPFGGAASVLLRKPRSYAEVYNDLDDEVVALMEVLRDAAAGARLVEALRLTPFSRVEFERAYKETDDLVEQSRRLIIRSFMGFGSDGFNRAVKTGFRSTTTRAGTTPATDWGGYPDCLTQIVGRISRVVIEHRDALEVMAAHDGPATLHYVDPPYMPKTRSDKSRKTGERYHTYRHEMTEEGHQKLLEFLLGLKGYVVLSGYPDALYDRILTGWTRVERKALADGARTRTEALWINPRAKAARGVQGVMFEHV